MGIRAKHLVAVSMLVGGALLVGASPPAGADYVPFTIADPVEGPAGTVITVQGDTWCATTTQEPGENIQPGVPGTVLVEFGVASWPREISTESALDEVLVSTKIKAGADGMWSAQLTVPEGTPIGEDYGVMGHCTVLTGGQVPTTSTTTTEGSSTTEMTEPPPPDVAPARAAAQVDDILSFDFLPAQFKVTAGPAEVPPSVPAGALPADAVPGQADFTG